MFTYIKIVLAIYMAGYLVVNPIFLHNHEIDGENIVHSHPIKSTSHTASAAKIIKYFNATQLIESDLAPQVACLDVCIREIFTQIIDLKGYKPVHSEGERAPPVI